MKLKGWSLLVGAGIGAVVIGVNLASCVSIPKGAKAVRPFDTNRYLGKWYEIARMDFRFEKNLSNVTATYSLNKDGSIKVNNKGYDLKGRKWKQSIGKAKLLNHGEQGRLKVSFFGPFYAGYNVIAIDKDYQYALIAGNNLNYLWILSRTQSIPESIKADYLNQAKTLGYEVEKLIWTKQGEVK